MSRENVELVRRALAAFVEAIDQGGDPVAAIFDSGLVAPTATLTPARERPDWRIYIGREGLTEFLHAWTEDFLEWTLRAEEIVDGGGDRVAVILRQSATGKASGAVVELRFGIVYTLQHGQVVDQREFLDPLQALGAVGLRE